MATVAIIPARGGSKGIPRKNLRVLSGQPLIAWSIGQARACTTIDSVIVSTDDPEIADVARKSGADVPFMRPASLAGDLSSTEDVLAHTIESLAQTGRRFDRVVLLQPTSPIRRPDSLSRALALFEETGADSLVSLVESHPFVWRAGDYFTPTYDPLARPRRQDLTDDQRLFLENGSIYISSTSALSTSRCRVSGRVAGFVMSREESIDIDDELDFRLAEASIQYLGLTK